MEPCTYFACTDPPYPVLARSREQARARPDWSFHALPTGHDAMIMAPGLVVDALPALSPCGAMLEFAPYSGRWLWPLRWPWALRCAMVHEDFVAAHAAVCAVRLGVKRELAQLLSSPVWRDPGRGEQIPGRVGQLA
jgi:hypothetical protein